MRGALLGVGQVAVHGHLPGWRARSDVEIVAAADGSDARRGEFLAAYPDARWYSSPEELLGLESLDFVDICTPPDSHAALARAALERSIHVLCEKPLVLSPEDLRGLPALAAEKDRTLFTVHNWKHAPILAKATELVRSGRLGDVRRIRWEALRDKPAAASGDSGNWRVDPARSGGGVLVDHGWHALYLVSGWLPVAPLTVAAALDTRVHHDWPVEDTADVFLAYPAATAEIFLTWAADERANRAEIHGADARLSLDGGRLALSAPGGGDALEEWTFPPLTDGSHHSDWFGGVVREFLEEIAEPSRRGRNLIEATLCAHVLSLAKESSRRGGEPLPAGRIAVPGRKA